MARWRIESTAWLDPVRPGKVAHAAWLVRARGAEGAQKSIEAVQVEEISLLPLEQREASGRPVSWLKPYLDDERLPDRIFLTPAGVIVEYDSGQA